MLDMVVAADTFTTGTVENDVPLNSRAVIPTGTSAVNVRTPSSGKDTFAKLPISSFANFATCCIGPIVKVGNLMVVPEALFKLTLIVAGVRLGLMTEIPVLTNNGRTAPAAADAAGLFPSRALR